MWFDARVRVLLLLAIFGATYKTALNSYGMFGWDEAQYASIGRSVARGEGFAVGGEPNPLRPPILPLAIAATIRLTGRTEDAVVKRPALVFSLLALAVTYWIAATAYDELTGLAAAALLGVCPAFWTSTPLLLSEIPFMAFFAPAVVCFYFGLYRNERYFYACWLLWAVAYLTRYTAVLFAPMAALFLVLAFLSADPAVRRRMRSRHMLLAPAAGFLIIAPWLIRQQITFGDMLIGMRQASSLPLLFMPGTSMPWYYYFVHAPAWLSLPIAVLVLAGAVWLIRSCDRFGLHALAASAVLFVWMSCYRYKELRYLTSILPLLAVVAAAAARAAVLAARVPRRAIAIAGLLLVAIAGAEFRVTRPVLRESVTLGYPSFLDAMQFLRAHSSPSAVIVGANVPQIAWYADRHVLDVPDRSQLPETLARAEWLVLTNFERGQPSYAGALMQQLMSAGLADGSAVLFRDRQFQTLLVRSTIVQQRAR